LFLYDDIGVYVILRLPANWIVTSLLWRCT